MLAVPAPIEDPVNQADWLEAMACIAADGDVAGSDLAQYLTVAGGPQDDASAIEALVDDAFDELQRRARECGSQYPFDVQSTGPTALLRKRTDGTFPAYLFCLGLSLTGADRDDADESVAVLFEKLATIAARQYLNGEAVRFGHPREDPLPPAFAKALGQVCDRLREGCARDPLPDHLADAKDGSVDVVAWKAVGDERPGQLLLLGQCAAGGNWSQKLNDLQPPDFMDFFLTERFVEPVKTFFTPFRLPGGSWHLCSTKAGIVFDRCRIARLTEGTEGELTEQESWFARQLQTFAGGGVHRPPKRHGVGRRMSRRRRRATHHSAKPRKPQTSN